MTTKVLTFAVLAVLIISGTAFAAELAPYKPVDPGVSGSLKFAGSNTLSPAVKDISAAFRKNYPNVQVSLEDKGTATAPPALIAGTVLFGNMSREIKAKEVEDFEKKFGYKPARQTIGVDAIAVFVHKDNPIKGLTMKQLDGIFSKTLKGGGKDIKTWGDLGIKGEWAAKPISLYGRNSASGTYAYFKEEALFKGDYKDTVKEQAGSAGVVAAAENDKYGIGYSGIGYKTANVKVVPIGKKDGEYFEPTPENAYSGKYSLARGLYQYFNKNPKEKLSPLAAEWIKFCNSKEGQENVKKSGSYPIDSTQAKKNLEAAGL